MKQFYLKIMLSCLFTLFGTTAFAYDCYVGDIYYNLNKTSKTATVTYLYLNVYGSASNSSAYKGVVTIPQKIKYDDVTYSVTSIGDYAFEGCYGLTSVTIPNSVTSIGSAAFAGCSGLTSVTIPNSVTSIHAYAFEGCYGLTSVTIPNSVTTIGNSAFYGCSSLTAVHITNLVAWCGISFFGDPFTYAHHLYLNGEEVKDLVIPNSVTSIGDGAFRNCSGLTSITIPNSVTSIGGNAFLDCSGLTSITVEEGNSVFDSRDECNAIIETSSNTLVVGCQNTTILNSVTSIGAGAFYKCSGLTSVTIPNSVTSIGERAFSYCSGLTSVTIPNSVTSIGYAAFSYCSGLTSVTIPNSVTSIGGGAFEGCSGLTSVTIPNSVTSIGGLAFQYCTGLTSITIPNSVTSIGSWAFCGCSGLTSVTIPNSVTSIGDQAFLKCNRLADVYCYVESASAAHADIRSFKYATSGTLHVPASALTEYKTTSPWSEFYKIVPLTEEETGIETIVSDTTHATGIYTLDGKQLRSLRKGVNIIKYQNGTTRKVLMK